MLWWLQVNHSKSFQQLLSNGNKEAIYEWEKPNHDARLKLGVPYRKPTLMFTISKMTCARSAWCCNEYKTGNYVSSMIVILMSHEHSYQDPLNSAMEYKLLPTQFPEEGKSHGAFGVLAKFRGERWKATKFSKWWLHFWLQLISFGFGPGVITLTEYEEHEGGLEGKGRMEENRVLGELQWWLSSRSIGHWIIMIAFIG